MATEDFSYTTILTHLRDNMMLKLGASNLLLYSTNQRILEVIAEELQELARYDEYLTKEAKWSLAQNRSSLLTQTEMFGYTPNRMVGSVGALTVSASSLFNGTYPVTIEIPKFTQFSNGELTFAASSKVVLYPTFRSVSVPVVQGVVKTASFKITSEYSPYENIQLNVDGDSIEDTLYQVTVNGIVWTETTSFTSSDSVDSTLFKISNILDSSGVYLTFGDGNKSKALALNDLVVFTYLETAGEDGEVLEMSSVTTVVSTLTDTSKAAVKLYCKNEENIIGGSAAETLESIRTNAPLALKASSRLVSADDYFSAIYNLKIIDQLAVWGEYETNLDNGNPPGTFLALEENRVNVTAINYSSTDTAIGMTDTQKETIRTALKDSKGLTDILTFIDPQIILLNFVTTVYYDPSSYTGDSVYDTVLAGLEATYSIENTARTFKESLYFSQYYEYINGLEGVHHHITELELSEISLLDTDAGGYQFDLDLGLPNVRPESISLYIKCVDASLDPNPFVDWTLMAVDDGSGGFKSESLVDPIMEDTGFIIEQPSGTLFDYASGVLAGIVITGDSINTYTGDISSLHIKTSFKTGTTTVDVVPNHRWQIFGYENAEIAIVGTV